MAAAHREPSALASVWLTLLCVTAILGGSFVFCEAPLRPGAEEKVAELRIEGNDRFPVEKIVRHVHTRAGRPYDPEVVEEDVRRLVQARMFVDVKASTQQVPGGRIVIFRVREREILDHVRFVGCQKIKRSVLAKEVGLKVGDPLDRYAVTEGRRKLEDYYRSKGFGDAHVSIFEGDKEGDQGVTYVINEGPKARHLWTQFVGNTFSSEGRLRTQIKSKPGFLWLFGGDVDRKQIDEDANRLTAYYRSMGFFQARVGRELGFNEAHNWLVLTFVIDEGPRYEVRNVSLVGNAKFTTEELTQDLKLRSGKPFHLGELNADVAAIQDIYGGDGYLFVDAKADTRFLEEPGKVDLIYNIVEGERCRVGKINVKIEGDYPHTRITTVLNRMSLRPGQIADIRELRASERRIKASNLFAVDPARGVAPRISFSKPRRPDDDTEIAEQPRRPSGYRGQSPDPEEGERGDSGQPGSWSRPLVPVDDAPRREARRPAAGASRTGPSNLRWVSHEDARQPAAGTPVQPASALEVRQREAPAEPGGYAGLAASRTVRREPRSPGIPQGYLVADSREPTIYRGQSGTYDPGEGYAAPALTEPRPTVPRLQTPGVGPDTRQPLLPAGPPAGSPSPALANPLRSEYSARPEGRYLPPGPVSGSQATINDATSLLGNPPNEESPLFVPLEPLLEEAPTGRFIFSVGVNSDLGVLGSVVVDEQNFDWTRWPRSWDEVINGQAFRGNGQRFRAEAMPGSRLQRYTVNFTEPYLFDSPLSFGLGGYFYDRRYFEWTERHGGGRIAFGYQFLPDLSGTIAYRLEDVGVRDSIVPRGVVPAIDEVLGSSTLHGIRAQLTRDTRDNTFLATEGYLFEIGFEQVLGTFQYPRGDIDLRKYFLIRQHPDGSGRQVLSLSGRMAVTGADTPIYDHYYAGGFTTIRGFEFRGASPRDPATHITLGGHFSLLASAEYMFPITADDALRGVVFCDTGTVEPSINDWRDRYRVAPGFGLRIMIPAMGPAPIALDFAFPISKEPGDQRQVFSFFIGFLR